MIEISGHPVGGAEIELLLLTLRAEEIDAAVLQEASHHRTHLDIFAQSGDSGTQAAYAAHKEPDLDAGGGGLEKLADNVRVGE